jgi:uncharacterized lipoprotein YajG
MFRTSILLATLLLAACTDSKTTLEVLDAEGYTNVKTTGYSPFACSKDDLSATGFTATSVTGRHVDGVVCCGLLKSCTVRIGRVVR